MREGGGAGHLGEMSIEEVMGLEALSDEMGMVLAREAAIATHRSLPSKGGTTYTVSRVVRAENGSSQGLNLALTGLFVPR